MHKSKPEWNRNDASGNSASRYLAKRGYTYDWYHHTWTKSSSDPVTKEEREAIFFLIENDWTLGGLDG